MTKKLSLQSIILLLISCAMLATFIGVTYVTLIESKENNQKNILTENAVYSEKLAGTTDLLFQNMINTLEVSAANIYSNLDDPDLVVELNQLLKSSNFFNAIYLVDKEGYIVKSTPKLILEGTKVTTMGVKEAIFKKYTTISQPYRSQVTGKNVVLVSVPVYNKTNGEYFGFLGGTIHLNEINSLQDTLSLHPSHSNGSYVYVVDSKGQIIYHPESERIGDTVIENKVVAKVTKGHAGKEKVINTKGIKMLAGYAPVKTSEWGIISQTPEKSIMTPALNSVKDIIKYTVPIFIIIYLLSFLLLRKIFSPLRKLTKYAKDVATNQKTPTPVINNNSLEISELKRTIFKLVTHYNMQILNFEKEVQFDHLTGLLNRRSFNKMTSNLDTYSMVLFDIDHFKKVNDTYGHLMGDEVLKFIANIVLDEIKDKGHCFRFGGEEFLLVLPETSVEEAYRISEKLRTRVQLSISPVNSTITISLGVGGVPYSNAYKTEALDQIDKALYIAKNEGRNRTIIAESKQ
ncbi:sensor domain-containing diguanylate cyclase [Metabacillus litoralis]|uniref:sensor domain-containing diguanylate cyclase n=1 Tax=Metabacillus litoralis TaxID=152268 RepID=UPI001CFEC51F|nr:sensor domain-containing diguanylate cyclase [Metabacillus litoralis]